MKKQKKRPIMIPLNKFTLMIILLITGMIWAPLSICWAATNPARATWLLAQMALGAGRLYLDARKLVKTAIVKITPPLVWDVLAKVEKPYKKYGLAAAHKVADESLPGVNLHSPKDSLPVRLLKGLCGIGKKVFNPVEVLT